MDDYIANIANELMLKKSAVIDEHTEKFLAPYKLEASTLKKNGYELIAEHREEGTTLKLCKLIDQTNLPNVKFEINIV